MADLNSTIIRGNLRVTEEIIGSLNVINLSTGANGQFLSISNNVPTWVNNPNTWRPLGTGANDAAAGNHSHDNRYLSLGGGTLTGALNFNNSTWNLVGDDVYIGDYDQAGSLGVKGKNGQTNIGFVNQSNDYYIKLASPGVTANRTITMPDDTGTIALTKNIPTSLPASDVYAWAKAATKPIYNWSEITQSGANNIEEGTSDVTDNTELFTSYASNNGFADSAATGKVYRRDAIKIYNYVKDKLDSVYLPLTGGTVTGELIMSSNRLWIQGGSAAGSNSNRLTTSSGMPGDMQYNNGKRGLQLYSNGIALADPYNGGANNDSAWIRHLETTSNAGLLEIAAGDDASNEDIRFRYYDTGNNIAHDILVPKKTGTIALTNDIPTSLPASDVYDWAKASTKPSYSWNEINNKPSTFPPDSHTHDDRYYTKSEMNTKLNEKSDTGHTHSYLPLGGGALTGTLNLQNSSAGISFTRDWYITNIETGSVQINIGTAAVGYTTSITATFKNYNKGLGTWYVVATVRGASPAQPECVVAGIGDIGSNGIKIRVRKIANNSGGGSPTWYVHYIAIKYH